MARVRSFMKVAGSVAVETKKNDKVKFGGVINMKLKKKPAAPARKGVSPSVKDPRLTKTGQHMPCSSGCLSTSLKGLPCSSPRVAKGLPYCKLCMAKGDPSLRVTQHPKFGNILVATRDLPKGYYVGWWGAVKGKQQMSDKAMEWALETTSKPKKYIDATPFKGSQLQFTACPGPGEVTTINFANNLDSLLDAKSSKSCLLFATLREIPKNHQFTMMYNKDEKSTDSFFRDMGIERADVGTANFPALRKANKGPAPWVTSKKQSLLMKAIKSKA